MSAPAPKLVIIAGPNGAGKSTFAARLLPAAYDSPPFLNADVVARELNETDVENVNFKAGRIVLAQMDGLIEQRSSFALETTLASRTLVSAIKRARRLDYEVELFFLWLPNAELAVARVADRVAMGGHDMPATEIRRRYQRGLCNFFKLYRALAYAWYVYDNTGMPLRVAAGAGSEALHIYAATRWRQLLKAADEC